MGRVGVTEVLRRGKCETHLATPLKSSGLRFHKPASLPSPFPPCWQQLLPKLLVGVTHAAASTIVYSKARFAFLPSHTFSLG